LDGFRVFSLEERQFSSHSSLATEYFTAHRRSAQRRNAVGVTIKFICHASLLLTTKRTSILCDPWFNGEVFNNGWQLSPQPEREPLNDAELASVTHVFISHEHPDHLHFPTLATFDESFKKRVVVLFQRNNSDKVFDQLKTMGYSNCVSFPHMQEYSPEPGVSLYIYQHRQIDSALIVKDTDHVVVNLNDAELTASECAKVRAKFGTIDALLTQFSIAGSQGYPDADRLDAKRVLEKVVEQTTILKPRFVIPFASYMRFCRVDNNHLNEFATTCLDVTQVLHQKGFDTHLLFPGNALDLDEQSMVDDEQRFVEFYGKQTPVAEPVEEPVDTAMLQSTIRERVAKWQAKYPSLLFRRMGEIVFYVRDLDTILVVNFKLNTVRVDDTRTADIEMNSQPLFFTFKFDFGVQTLGVSGRYKINHPEAVMPRWKVVRIVSSLYNAELFLTWSGLINRTMLRWVWQRKSNLLADVGQQVRRFARA
jgi:UDP-MurNAc hydroxylase